MRLAHVIKELSEMHDQVKYHGGKIGNIPEFLEGLCDELRSINADEIVEARAAGAENGFNYARNLVLKNILQNPALKKRGEMIEALEKLNGDTILSETKETGTEKAAGERSVHHSYSLSAREDG